MCPHLITCVCKSVEASSSAEISRGDNSSLTAALIDLIFGMQTPIRSIGVVGYMNLTFEVIKGHLWEIFTKTSDDTRSFKKVETFFFFYSQLKVKGALKFGI